LTCTNPVSDTVWNPDQNDSEAKLGIRHPRKKEKEVTEKIQSLEIPPPVVHVLKPFKVLQKSS